MHPNLLPTFSLLLIAILTFNHIPKSFCQDQQYVACGETFWCGNLSFRYPFWGGSRTSSCGYPGFELTCRENVTFLRVEPVTYRVLVVDALQRRLTLARDDLWSTLCPTYIHNTTFNTNIFTYSSSNQYLTLSYRCTILVANFSRPQNQFDCGVNTSTSSPSFYSTNTLGINPTNVGCSDAITVPVNEAAAQNLRSSEPLPAVLNGGFGLQWAANDTNCDRCIGSNGRCGYNSSTNSFVCYCSDRAYNLTCNNIQPQNGNGNGNGSSGLSVRVILALGISFGMVGLITIAVVYCVFKPSCEPMICWKPDKENNQNIEAFVRNYGSLVPKCYSFSELKKMTDSFGHPLGQGGYGFVYKGKLPDGRQVAVKVLRDNTGNGEEFINEVASISRTSHVNVVTLLGFCYKANRRALVYEFMSNGSLDKFICNNESQVANNRLEWRILYQIAVGIARGLEYLHRGCNTRIVHFDIKPQNILLDKDFCPKISDFGLAKLCENKQSILSTTGARGTVGYIAPEVVFRSIGGVSHKSDVYSYGIMVLEMVGLKSRIKVDTEKSSETYFPNWIYEHLELGKDIGLEGIVNAQEEEDARKMILVGLWCIQTKPSERPSMSKVVEMLEGSLQSLQIPPKPYLLDAPAVMRSSQGSSSTSFS